jgi:hypothetical protein
MHFSTSSMSDSNNEHNPNLMQLLRLLTGELFPY